MNIFAKIMTLIVAIEHFGFLILEMFFWDHPIGRGAFNLTAELSGQTTAMAANQGLYNGFLAAGLIWALIAKKRDVRIFFLGCIIIAGIFGAATVKPSIVIIQALPALIALALVLMSRRA